MLEYLNWFVATVSPDTVKTSVAVLGAVALVTIVMTLVLSSSSFENNPNSIRRYIVSGETSLDERMQQARKSNLTGSRDAPVFFSDYDVQMYKDKEGALVQENFVNEKVTDLTNIENRFMLN